MEAVTNLVPLLPQEGQWRIGQGVRDLKKCKINQRPSTKQESAPCAKRERTICHNGLSLKVVKETVDIFAKIEIGYMLNRMID